MSDDIKKWAPIIIAFFSAIGLGLEQLKKQGLGPWHIVILGVILFFCLLLVYLMVRAILDRNKKPQDVGSSKKDDIVNKLSDIQRQLGDLNDRFDGHGDIVDHSTAESVAEMVSLQKKFISHVDDKLEEIVTNLVTLIKKIKEYINQCC